MLIVPWKHWHFCVNNFLKVNNVEFLSIQNTFDDFTKTWTQWIFFLRQICFEKEFVKNWSWDQRLKDRVQEAGVTNVLDSPEHYFFFIRDLTFVFFIIFLSLVFEQFYLSDFGPFFIIVRVSDKMNFELFFTGIRVDKIGFNELIQVRKIS